MGSLGGSSGSMIKILHERQGGHHRLSVFSGWYDEQGFFHSTGLLGHLMGDEKDLDTFRAIESTSMGQLQLKENIDEQ